MIAYITGRQKITLKIFEKFLEMNQNQIDAKYLKLWITKFIQTSEQKPQPETTLPYWNGI